MLYFFDCMRITCSFSIFQLQESEILFYFIYFIFLKIFSQENALMMVVDLKWSIERNCPPLWKEIISTLIVITPFTRL